MVAVDETPRPHTQRPAMARRTVYLDTTFSATTSGATVPVAANVPTGVTEYYVVVGVPASAAQVTYLNLPIAGTVTAGASQNVIGTTEATNPWGPYLVADGNPKISTLASTQTLYVAIEIEAS